MEFEPLIKLLFFPIFVNQNNIGIKTSLGMLQKWKFIKENIFDFGIGNPALPGKQTHQT